MNCKNNAKNIILNRIHWCYRLKVGYGFAVAFDLFYQINKLYKYTNNVLAITKNKNYYEINDFKSYK